MKKILGKLMAVIAAVAVLGAIPSMAFFTNPLSAPSTGKLMKPSFEYELDTWGANSEIYEFTPKAAPHMTCVVFMNDEITTLSMECFPKQEPSAWNLMKGNSE